ncbi:adenine glycosylase [Enemella dayhoffiae]|uniref:Adenine DNA glycosylase n=1 Tax=Enemella dayhoffiae TaxID=2016507 RepID=A0A255H5A5_9ACTN|nr:A/G-specific adenine glycosylase [Enemella dayhoffiae]OYO22769.1 adenine glycosylase [Enemella dayhoffiae]
MPERLENRHAELVTAVVDWFGEHARDLPWRRPEAGPWGVLVSEFMLQQTPVSRVLEPWAQWLQRWPSPATLAADPPGEAVRMWGRLGYPRRALRLHAAAVAIVERHDGQIPADHDALLALPGVGAYTAAAVSAFAFGGDEVVLDTNVRRVLARAVGGVEFQANSPTAAERRLAAEVWPPEGAARWSAAAMELGALVCTAATPRCVDCPILADCAWVTAGRPPHSGPPRRGQAYAGTDRQVRGRLLEVLRASEEPVAAARLDLVWDDPVQRDRALASLLTDGLVVRRGKEYALP